LICLQLKLSQKNLPAQICRVVMPSAQFMPYTENRKLKNACFKKKYPFKYRQKLKKQIAGEHNKSTIFTLLSVIIAISILPGMFFTSTVKCTVLISPKIIFKYLWRFTENAQQRMKQYYRS
jgi:hypothetical protein